MWMLLLLACPEPRPGAAELVDPADSAEIEEACGTWVSVGHPFVLQYCTSCHSSRLLGEARYRAPDGVDFDTLAGVRTQSSALKGLALGETAMMPPRGGVPAAEREAMAAWLACGAPGEEAELPVSEGNPALLSSMLLTGGVSATADGVELYAEEAGLPWSTQSFVVTGPTAALSTSVRYEEGLPIETLTFDPPLPIYDADAPILETTVSVTREAETGTTSGSETWTVTRAVEVDPDPRLLDAAPWRVIAEHDGEPELEWWFSDTRMLVGQAARVASGEWYILLHQNPGTLRTANQNFPLEAGGGWATRGYLTLEAP